MVFPDSSSIPALPLVSTPIFTSSTNQTDHRPTVYLQFPFSANAKPSAPNPSATAIPPPTPLGSSAAKSPPGSSKYIPSALCAHTNQHACHSWGSSIAGHEHGLAKVSATGVMTCLVSPLPGDSHRSPCYSKSPWEHYLLQAAQHSPAPHYSFEMLHTPAAC